MSPTDPSATPWERRISTGDGSVLIRLSWIGTVASCVSAVVNALTGSRTDFLLSAIPGLVMFVGGSVVFLLAFLIAVQRSRTESIGVGGLYFLAGCAPPKVQRSMVASVVVQTAIPLAVTLIRPFVAFSVLAPMWSLGLAGLWGALHGTFPPRSDPDAVAAATAAGPMGQTPPRTDVETEAPGDG